MQQADTSNGIGQPNPHRYAKDMADQLQRNPIHQLVTSAPPGAPAHNRASRAGTRRGVCVRLIAQSRARQAELEKAIKRIPGLKHCETQVAATEHEILNHDEPAGWSALDRRLVVFDTRLAFANLLTLVTQYTKQHQNHYLVVISPRLAPWQEAEVVEAGARALIPCSFRQNALEAVLALVLAGQRYRPHGKRSEEPGDVFAAGNVDDMAAFPDEPEDALPTRPLTRAEMRVCGALVTGKPHKEMATDLGVCVGVINIHLNRIKHKFRIRSLTKLRTVLQRLRDMDLSAFERALRGEKVNLDWLYELMTVEHMRQGQELFKKGDAADKLYLIVKGEVSLPQIGKIMGPDTYFGEVGIFTPEQIRTHTAVCATDVELRSLDLAQVRRFYQLKPVFATQMLVLITQRLRADIKRLEELQVELDPPDEEGA